MRKTLQKLFLTCSFLLLGVVFFSIHPHQVYAGTTLFFEDFNKNWANSGGGCFDGGPNSLNQPAGWIGWSIDSNRCVQKESYAHPPGGSIPSVKIVVDETMVGSEVPSAGLYKRVEGIKPGYRYSIFGMTQRQTDNGVNFVGFQFCSATICNPTRWQPLHGVPIDGEPNNQHLATWYPFDFNQIAPSDGSFYLNVFIAGGSGHSHNRSMTTKTDVWFDDLSLLEDPPDVPVITPTPRPYNNARCEAMTYLGVWDPDIYAQIVEAGKSYDVSLSLRNIGTTTWTSRENYRLGSTEPRGNLTWGVGRVNLQNEPVWANPDYLRRSDPGAVAHFNFTVTAPTTPGRYEFAYQMLREGVEWFGSDCYLRLTVVAPTSAIIGGGIYASDGTTNNKGQPLYHFAPHVQVNATGQNDERPGNISDGTWNMTVPFDTGYAVRGPNDEIRAEGFLWTPVVPSFPGGVSSYENQQANGGSADCGKNSSCDFIYKVAPPTNLAGSCSSNQAFISWDGFNSSTTAPHIRHYNLRIDNTSNGWSNDCNNLNPGDYCVENYQQRSCAFRATPGKSYRWWVDAYNTGSVVSTDGPDFSCAGSPQDEPSLGALRADANSAANAKRQGDSGTTATFKTSGLRTEEGGSSYYNSFIVSQYVEGDASKADLVGIGFTSKTSPPSGSLSSLIASANAVSEQNGFILVRANKTTTVNGKAFAAGQHYIYYKGVWNDIPEGLNGYTNLNNITVKVIKSQDPTKTKNNAPTFSVTLHRGIGNHVWGTYGYLKPSSGSEIVAVRDPKSITNLSGMRSLSAGGVVCE